MLLSGSLPTCTLQSHVSVGAPMIAGDDRAPLPPHPPILFYQRHNKLGRSSRPAYVAHRMSSAAPSSPAAQIASRWSAGAASSATDSDVSDIENDADAAYLDARIAVSRVHKAGSSKTLFVMQSTDATAEQGSANTAAIEELRRLALVASVVDFILVLYSVLTNKWQGGYSTGVIIGMILSNAIFTWAIRVYRSWVVTAVAVLLALNFAIVFSVDTLGILFIRLLVVVAEIGTLVRLRSLMEPAVFFL
ncbi:transmembrane protein, putative [Bodo saltans]|uniref:Transmembrane protein, putative n=1 Tax=Bodo saltans TaxID=75058 RepID=A0A0S4IQN1_BODSA|nr:transmembrane protein, putative [Bodo saltans]|eukprot:CUF97076.1 transmembrane protein, putative [Bodo saltans]